jgi:hypothetical protein
MSKGKRNRIQREAVQIAHDHTQHEEGFWLGEVDPDQQPAAKELIRRYNEVAKNLRACPHLQENREQVRFWVEAVPELLACKACTPHLATEEKKRANSRCLMCGRHVELRGFSVTVNGILLRGGLCEQCEAEHELSA